MGPPGPGFQAGLLRRSAALTAALVACSPLYGFFAWTGYLFVGPSLPGRRRIMAGAAGVAILGATSQVGGFQVLADRKSWPTFAVVLAFNVGIGVAMTALAYKAEMESERRRQTIKELAEANGKLAAAMRENAGLHAQLLTQAREAGMLDERQRMAGEIHDVLAQGLTGIVTQLEAADAAAARPDDRARHLDRARTLARDSLTEARRSVQALRPQPLAEAALPDALADVVDGWSKLHGVPVEMITTGTPQVLRPEIETTLLRTAQEALANVARHAEATRVALTLSYMEDLVTLDERDDAARFDTGEPRETTVAGGYGLAAIR
ncbi:histidine kinase, partial [Actinoplanes sp. NPDC051633]|uniref:sensor histidine kinase n=1 Tax=Actinoplanes sp. NPDC051633 TaxID=3155670 RepID=UPI00342D9047